MITLTIANVCGCRRVMEKVKIPLNQMTKEDKSSSPSRIETQLYEEIKDSEPSTRVDPPKAATVPQYEEVMIATGMASKSSDSYQITVCEAYGVSQH